MQEQQEQRSGFSQQFNALVAVGQMLGGPVCAITRIPGTTGERVFGGQTAIGMVLMFVLIGEWDPRIAVWAEIVVACFLFLHRVCGIRTRKHLHSLDVGRSWFGRRGEVVFLIIAATAALAVCPGLGLYLFLAMIGIALDDTYFRLRMNALARAQRDARIEAEQNRAYCERRNG
jgi:hypothetical protein